MNDTENVISKVALGHEAEAFIKSNIGRRLIEKVEAEVASAVEVLKKVDPDDTKTIMAAQAKIWRAESFQFWLAEMIQDGWNSEQEFIRTQQGD